MPTGEMPYTCMCLREARRAAGYQTLGQAGLATHRSQEAIGRHERGDVAIQMADAIEYATAYDSPVILMAYCGECQIRHALFGQQQQRTDSLALTAFRMSNRLKKAAGYADRLAEMLDDGKLDGTEIAEFQATMDYLLEVNSVWRELVTACLTHGYVGIKKDRPAGTGAIQVTIKSAHHSRL